MKFLWSGAAALCVASACAPAIVPMATQRAAIAVVADTMAAADPVPADVIVLPAAPHVEPSISSSDVLREALAVFGDTSVALPAAGVGLLDAEAAEPSPVWDINVRSFEGQSRVEWWVKRLSIDWRDSFGAQIRRGVPYDSMMRAKLHAGGIPEDMVYLALIESGFDPHAYSRAAAVGMWQFMATTARGVGLRVDWWVDERRDPVRATDAAVIFINELRRQFGSLYLAAAAYNGGPTRIARGLTRYADDFEGTTGDSLFFALAEKDVMRAETRDYVPKLIAAALIAKTPERYGIRVPAVPSFSYDSVRVPGSTPLAAVAKAAGTSLAMIRDLNPHILRGMIPRGPPMVVRLPTGRAAAFAESFAALEERDRATGKRVTSKQGETLASIARREKNGLTARTIGWYNPKLSTTKRGALRPGQTIFVPTPDVAAAAFNIPDPKLERYPRRSGAVRSGAVRSGAAKPTTKKSATSRIGIKIRKDAASATGAKTSRAKSAAGKKPASSRIAKRPA